MREKRSPPNVDECRRGKCSKCGERKDKKGNSGGGVYDHERYKQ